MMPRICFLLAPVALLLMGCELVGAGGGDRYTADFQLQFAQKAGGRLAVDSVNGSVEVTAWDKEEVEVMGVKSCAIQEDLARIEVKGDQANNALRLRVVRPERLRNCGVRMMIRAPRMTTVEEIRTSIGAVRLEDMKGNTRIESTNGSVNVKRHKGVVQVRTSNGRVSLVQVIGGADVRTSNGSVLLEGVEGTIAVESSNGSVKGSVAKLAVGQGVQVETSNGPIDLAFTHYAGQAIDLITSNASVTLELPEKANADVRASTSNGSVNSEFGPSRARGRWEGKLGTGGGLIRLETSNGEIRIQKL
jgi:hypothetical protein